MTRKVYNTTKKPPAQHRDPKRDIVFGSPSAAVEPARVVPELVQHLLHLERRGDRLQESSGPGQWCSVKETRQRMAAEDGCRQDDGEWGGREGGTARGDGVVKHEVCFVRFDRVCMSGVANRERRRKTLHGLWRVPLVERPAQR